MNNNSKKYYRDKLIEEKKNALKRLGNMSNRQSEFSAEDIYYEELSNYDNHPADLGTEMFLKEQDQGFKNQIKSTIMDINQSLVDLAQNNYGYCNDCSKDIEKERLEAIPYAKTCASCSKSQERAGGSKLYESIDDGYMTSFTYKGDELGYDREDSYQDVVQYDIVDKDPSYATGDYMGVFDEDDDKDDVANISQEYYDNTLK